MNITHEDIKAMSIVARKVHNNWKKLEYDDINGQLLEWLTRKAKTGKLQEWHDKGYHGKNSLYFSARSYANKWCKVQYEKQSGVKMEYYDETGKVKTFQYSEEQLKVAMEDLKTWRTIITDPNSRLMDIYIQLEVAYNTLNYAEQLLLEYKYIKGFTYKQVGQFADIKEDAARQRINRLITKLQKKIG